MRLQSGDERESDGCLRLRWDRPLYARWDGATVTFSTEPFGPDPVAEMVEVARARWEATA